MYLAITILILGLYVIYIQRYQTMHIFWNFHISQIFLSHIFHIPINRTDYVHVSLWNILRVIMYEWMSNCPFVCVSFHPSFVLSRLGLFDISHYWISHKAFAILQWPFISYIFLMVYRIPLLILRSRILEYKICVFLCFILSFSVNISLNLLLQYQMNLQGLLLLLKLKVQRF